MLLVKCTTTSTTIQEVLLYHHIPAKTRALISRLYTDFHTSIITDNYLTPTIPVRKGVLQGDFLSPLLFNMCFSTFIQYIRQEKYMQLGFSSYDKLDCLFKPIHLFQFADGAAGVTTNERENQLLLNFFAKWRTWSDMIIRVDKCVTFGIKKFSSCSLQYEPKLFINIEIVPTSNLVSPSNTLVAISTLKSTMRSIKRSSNPCS